MTKYITHEPIFDDDNNVIGDKELIVDDDWIMDNYYPYWSNKLKELGRDHLISKENCIDDWCAVNWAIVYDQ